MRPKKGPGVIPDWGEEFLALSTADRYKIAQAMGVTERTAHNWAKGRNVPTKSHAADIVRRMRRAK